MSGQMKDLYKVQKKDLSKASVVLADAFQHDPLWNKFFEGEAKFDQTLGSFFGSGLRYCLRYGQAYAPSEHLEGVAAWVSGDLADMTFWRMLRCGAMTSGWKTIRMGMKYGRKMQVVFEPIQVDKEAHMKGRAYLYLLMIGVASQLQRQGFGGRLLGELFEKSEQDGVPVYLETETEENVRMYERLGFRVLKEITIPVVDLPMWEMVREPRA